MIAIQLDVTEESSRIRHWAGFESTSIYMYCVYRPHLNCNMQCATLVTPQTLEIVPGVQPLLLHQLAMAPAITSLAANRMWLPGRPLFRSKIVTRSKK